jgi:hypothetical protein
MAVIDYYVSGKKEVPLNPPRQEQCHKCAAVQETAKVDDFDTERDAQIAWKWGGLKMLNTAVDALWGVLWNKYQCVNKDCNRRHACAQQPNYLRAYVADIAVPDATAPAGTKQVWRLCITFQRKIECLPAEAGNPEKDDPPEHYKELPPQAKEAAPQEEKEHPQVPDGPSPEKAIPLTAKTEGGGLVKR